MVPEAAQNLTLQQGADTSRLLQSDATVGLRTNKSGGNFTLINNGTIYYEDSEWPSVEVRIWPVEQEPEHYCAG